MSCRKVQESLSDRCRDYIMEIRMLQTIHPKWLHTVNHCSLCHPLLFPPKVNIFQKQMKCSCCCFKSLQILPHKRLIKIKPVRHPKNRALWVSHLTGTSLQQSTRPLEGNEYEMTEMEMTYASIWCKTIVRCADKSSWRNPAISC